MTYLCPVCGFDKLADPPERYSICPSCGTEFWVDDDELSHAELRRRWIASGAKWWSHDLEAPPYWSPAEQLRNVNHPVSDADKIAIADTSMVTAQVFLWTGAIFHGASAEIEPIASTLGQVLETLQPA